MGAKPLALSTAGRNASPAITLTARAVSTQVPFAGSEVVELTFQAPPAQPSPPSLCTPAAGQAAQLENSNTAGNQAGESGASFSLHLPVSGQPGGSTGAAGSPAPRQLLVPQDWQAAIQEVVGASLAAVGDNSHASQAAAAHGGAQGSPAPPTVAVAGPKGAGKSSLARLLVNQLLNHHPVVAYLDTDCGQPEVTPPGMVSVTLLTQPLLGAPYTHLRQPHFSHYMGDLSPEADPELYTAAVASLYRWYCSPACQSATQQLISSSSAHSSDATAVGAAPGPGSGTPSKAKTTGSVKGKQQPSDKAASTATKPAAEGATSVPAPFSWPPLVVNLHGWVTGLGCDLTAELTRIIGPSHMLQVRLWFSTLGLPVTCWACINCSVMFMLDSAACTSLQGRFRARL